MGCAAMLSLLCAAVLAADTPAVAAAAAAGNPVVVITTTKGAITCELFAAAAPKTVANFLDLAKGDKPAPGGKPFYDGLIFHRVIPNFMIQGGDPQGTGVGGPGYQFDDEINPTELGLDAKAIQGQGLHPWCGYMMGQFRQLILDPKLKALGFTQQTPQAERQALFAKALEQCQGVTLQEFYSALGYRYDASLPPSPAPVRGVLAMANSGPNTNGSQFFINLGDTPHLRGKHTVFGKVTAGMEVVEAIAAVERDDRDAPKQPVVMQSVRLQPQP
jgi:peptidyl-prolyl cis-trans isomerase A (cyclophilin A)